MTNIEIMNVCKRSKHLIGINFSECIWKIIVSFIIKSQNFVQRVRHVIHYQIQKYFIAFFFLWKKVIVNFDTIRMIQLYNNFEFPIRILGILIDLFDRHFFVVLLSDGFVNNSESSLPYYFNPFVLRRFVLQYIRLFLLTLFLLGLFEGRKQRLIFVEKIGIDLNFLIHFEFAGYVSLWHY